MLTQLSVYATIASTATAAYGQYAAGRAQAAQARRNRQIAGQLADDALRVGELEEERHRVRASQFMGRQRAAIGASGAAVGVGSAGALVEDSAAMAELDILTIRSNARRTAWGYESQAGSFAPQQEVSTLQSGIGTFGTLLGGAAQTTGIIRSGQ
jgi:hypothetical protein